MANKLITDEINPYKFCCKALARAIQYKKLCIVLFVEN